MKACISCVNPAIGTEEFCFDFEGTVIHTTQEEVRLADIRRLANIPPGTPIVMVLEDQTQRTVEETQPIKLVRCVLFLRLPRFTRG